MCARMLLNFTDFTAVYHRGMGWKNAVTSDANTGTGTTTATTVATPTITVTPTPAAAD